MKPLKRVYHPYTLWEEVAANMWGDVEDRKEWLAKAIAFTGDHKRYGSYMMRVIREWSVSSENALTDQRMNRKAWIGHAATALAIGCPEDIVRQAWGQLTDEQRLLANKEAARAIRTWELTYRADRGIREDVGEPMLFDGDTRRDTGEACGVE